MSLPKITGIETEYGILIRGVAESDPFLASRLLLQQYKQVGARQLSQESEHSSSSYGLKGQEGKSNDNLSASKIVTAQDPNCVFYSDDSNYDLMLPNGARFYIDHAHPEYSTAEAATPRGVVAADKAGEIIVERCCQLANASHCLPQEQEIVIYKNNSDQKGNSYGCHENYLLNPSTFEDLLHDKSHRTWTFFAPFLVSRQILCGAGKVGAENGTTPVGFQLAQRADFFEALVGLQTTHRRPLINTRDEPHADASRFRRLHVIVGDANMAEYSTFLKVGTTQLVLMMLEDDYVHLNLALQDPLAALQVVSRDLTFQHKLSLENGGGASALEIQRQYLTLAHRYLEKGLGTEALHEVVRIWEDTLNKLSSDWRSLSSRLDWAIKRNLLERYLQSHNSDWKMVSQWQLPIELTLNLDYHAGANDTVDLRENIRVRYPGHASQLECYVRQEGLNWADYWRQREIYFTLRRLDLEYHDIRHESKGRDCGVFYRLQQHGAVERLLDDREIGQLVDFPPEDTRAYLRGYCIAHYGECIRQLDWSVVSFSASGGRQSYDLALPDPAAPNKAQIGELLARAPDLPALLRELQEK